MFENNYASLALNTEADTLQPRILSGEHEPFYRGHMPCAILHIEMKPSEGPAPSLIVGIYIIPFG